MTDFLVTGGSGFIGTHLIEALVKRGHKVINVDLNPPKRDEQRAYWRKLDICDDVALTRVVDECAPDVIVNLAAIADILLGKSAFAVNTVGLENLLSATKDYPKKPRLIHASTQLVVGAGYTPMSDRDYNPYTEYGESKAESEEVLWNWPGDIVWTIIRPAVVWGPDYPGFADASWYYLQKRWYFLPSGNTAVKSYSYVGNLVTQIIGIAELPEEKARSRVYYGADCVIDSAIWLDAFSKALTGRAAPRIPTSILRLLAFGGDIALKLKLPSPINSGRLFRMTADYPVPLKETLEAVGAGPFTLEEGVGLTVDWLRKAYPDRFPSS